MTTTVDPLEIPDSALLSAAASGEFDRVAIALSAGARLEARDRRGRSALLLAVIGDHLAVARLLVDRGANPNSVDHLLDTPWLTTGVTGSVEMLEILLPACADRHLGDREGVTALQHARRFGYHDLAAALA